MTFIVNQNNVKTSLEVYRVIIKELSVSHEHTLKYWVQRPHTTPKTITTRIIESTGKPILFELFNSIRFAERISAKWFLWPKKRSNKFRGIIKRLKLAFTVFIPRSKVF